jgi:hypothetical protein
MLLELFNIVPGMVFLKFCVIISDAVGMIHHHQFVECFIGILHPRIRLTGDKPHELVEGMVLLVPVQRDDLCGNEVKIFAGVCRNQSFIERIYLHCLVTVVYTLRRSSTHCAIREDPMS